MNNSIDKNKNKDNVNSCTLFQTHFSGNDHVEIIGCKINVQTSWIVLYLSEDSNQSEVARLRCICDFIFVVVLQKNPCFGEDRCLVDVPRSG